MTVSRMAGNGYKNLEIALKNLNGFEAKVGWVEKQQYDDSDMTTAGAAVLAEYGFAPRNIPARPTGGPTATRQKSFWARIAEAESKKVLTGRQTGEGMMEVLGLQAAGDWRESITQLFNPPLSPRTIAARLRKKADGKTIGNLTKPLVESSTMLNALTNTVERS